MSDVTRDVRDLWAMDGDDHGLARLKSESDVSACLLPFLTVLGWRGDPRHVAEALPHFLKIDDMARLRAVLANLRFATRCERTRLADIDRRLYPCLFKPDRGPLMVLLRRDEAGATVFDGATAEIRAVDDLEITGEAFFAEADEATSEEIRTAARNGRWTHKLAERFRGLVLQMLGISFLTNLAALAVPIFIMSIYDKVIGAGDPQTLYYLFSGVLLILLLDGGLRFVRARILAYVAGRIDMMVGAATFEQILNLAIVVTERASIGAQISRLRQFESLREFFSGPLAGSFVDLPFVVVFLLVIAIIGGPLAWIPVGLLCAFAVTAALFMPHLRRVVAEQSKTRSAKDSFLIEMLTEMRTIKICALEEVWSRRFRELSAKAAMAGFRTARFGALLQSIAQILMLLAGISTLAVGALMVMAGGPLGRRIDRLHGSGLAGALAAASGFSLVLQARADRARPQAAEPLDAPARRA